MSKLQLDHLVQSIRQLAGAPPWTELTDRELLERFVTGRNEMAFAALVERHGGLVLGVCRRVLNHLQDAEDAFQATFLILARKAVSVRWQEEISDWLYAVAYRTALKARSQAARRQGRERPLADLPAVETTADLAWQELRPALDDEVRRLPEKYRAPLLLCYFHEKTYTEAARILGVAEGTVSSRLARARDRLRRRLVRRGLTLSAGLLTTTVARDALSAPVPANLLHSTTQAAVLTAAGKAVTGAVSVHVTALAERVVRAMFLTKLKIATGILLGISLAGGGVGLASYRALAGGMSEANAHETAAAQDDALRQENEQLKREVQDLRDRVRALEAKAAPSEARREKPLYEGKPAAFWIEQLKDRAPKYRVAALKALGGIAEVDRTLVPVIAEALKDRDIDVGRAAADALAPLGPDMIPIFAKVLKHNDARVRHVAIAGLFQVGSAATPVLLDALKDKDSSIRQMASQRLGDLAGSMDDAQSKAVVTALIAALPDRDDQVRVSAAMALASFGPGASAAVPALVESLRDKNVLLSAIRALGNIGPGANAAVPALRDIADFQAEGIFDRQIRTEAMRAVMRIAPDPSKKRYVDRPPSSRPDGQSRPKSPPP
jgi:RNA polymerase sigma factor (sigma-70 family)